MRAVLFDRGDTLEHNGAPLPGVVELLYAVRGLRDAGNRPVEMALVSDYYPAATAADSTRLRAEYLESLAKLGIARFFEPPARRVTLSSDSTDPEFVKPSPRIFRAALDKLGTGLPFGCTLFVTENGDHIRAARALGMTAIQFRAPGQTDGEVGRLVDLVPIIRRWV